MRKAIITPCRLMPDNILSKYRKEREKLLAEAKTFLAMGYKLDELILVCYPDRTWQIQPYSKENEDVR